MKSKRKRPRSSGWSGLQKPAIISKPEAALSGAEGTLTTSRSLSRDQARAARGRANECSVPALLSLSQNVTFQLFSLWLQPGKEEIKSIFIFFSLHVFRFLLCFSQGSLWSVLGNGIKLRESIPEIITDICMWQTSPALTLDVKFGLEAWTTVLWSFIPGLSTTGSFSMTNSIQILGTQACFCWISQST